MPKSNYESYPPLFRRPTREPDSNLNTNPTGKEMDPLPLIDVQCLDLDKLDRACREWGIFRVINHGVPTRLLKELNSQAKTIFDLPFESKQGLSNNTNINYFWGTPGLSSTGVPLPGAANADWVEGLSIPLAQLSLLHHHPLIITFRKMLEEYRVHLTRVASTLFEGMTTNLKLEIEKPNMYLDESSEVVRVYRYPGDDHDDHDGMHVHTDSSVLSILNEDEGLGGLQFLKDDQWLDVNPVPTTFVVNLGDMMQAMSDDVYKSVKHRVKLNKESERVSICYFVFPQENTVIKSSKYKPFTYSDFRAQVQHHLQTLGCKIGLQAFKLPLYN